MRAADDLNNMLAAHFNRERAIAAARRFISKSIADTVSLGDVAEFLRRRRDPLPEGTFARLPAKQ